MIISQRLQSDKDKEIKALCQPKPLPPLKELWTKHTGVSNLPELAEENVPSDLSSETKTLDKQGCAPEAVKNYLAQALDYFANRDDILGLMELKAVYALSGKKPAAIK